MKVTVIKFEQLFPTGEYANQRLSVEVEVPDFHPSTGESNWDKAMDAFKEAKELVNAAFQKLNPSQPSISQTVPEVHVSKKSMKDFLEGMEKDINDCETLKLLETFKTVVATYPELQSHYDKRLKELHQAHQADVLANTKLKQKQ